MNPGGTQQPVDSQDLQKLEEDLKNLENETSTANSSQPTSPTGQASLTAPPSVQDVPPVVVNNPSAVVSESSIISPTETPTPVQHPTSSTGSPKKNSLMLVAIILMVLAILAAIAYAIGMQFLGQKSVQSNVSTATTIPSSTVIPTSTPDPTTDWQMYTNKLGGYTFNYPPTWNATASSVNASQSLFGPNATSATGLGGVEVIKSTATVEQYLANIVSQGVISSVSQENITINNLPGVIIKYQGSATSGWSFYTKNGNSIYNINLNSWQDNDVSNFNLILSTFKFIDITNSINPSPTSPPSAMPAGY